MMSKECFLGWLSLVFVYLLLCGESKCLNQIARLPSPEQLHDVLCTQVFLSLFLSSILHFNLIISTPVLIFRHFFIQASL